MAENVCNPLERPCDAAGRALRGTHDSLRDSSECSFDDAFILLDKHLNVVKMNQVARKMFGQFVGDDIGKNILEVSPDFKGTERYSEYMRVMKTGEPFFADNFVPPFRLRDVRLSVKAFKVGNGLGLVISDLTERKRLETRFAEAEAKYQALVENSTDGIGISRGGQVIYANKAALEILGFETVEEIGKASFFEMVVPEDMALIEERLAKRLKGEPVEPKFEVRIRRCDGKVRNIETYTSEIALNGEKFVQSICRDITERRKMEEALRQSEQKLRSVLDSSVDMIYRANLKNGTYDYVSLAAEKVIGYTPEELMALGLMGGRSLVHPDDLEKLDRNVIDLVMHNGSSEAPSTIEYRFLHKNLGYRWMYDNRSVVYEDGNLPVAVVGVLRDITEYKIEGNLLQAERDLSIELNRAGSLQEGLQICLEAAIRASGTDCGGIYEIDEITGTLELKVHKGLSPEFVRATSHYEANSKNAQLVAAGKPVYAEHLNLGLSLTDEETSEALQAIAVIPLVREGKAIACMNIATKTAVTIVPSARTALEAIAAQMEGALMRLKSREALKESEQNYRELSGSITDIFFALDRNLRYTYWNRASEKLTGIKASDAIGKSISEIFGDNEQTRGAVDIYQKVLVTQQPQIFIKEYDFATNKYIFEIHVYPSERGLSVFAKDITERKKAEDALGESEQKFRVIFDNANDGFISVEPESRKFFNPNRKMIEMLGYDSADEVADLTILDIHPKPAISYILNDFEKHVRRETSRSEDIPVRRRDGSLFFASIDSYEVTIANKKYLSCIFRDITERRKVEDALRESETRFKQFFENAEVYCYMVTPDGKILNANKLMLETLGYTQEELVGKLVTTIFAPEFRPKAGELFEGWKKTGVIVNEEMVIITKQGERRTVLLSTSAVRDRDGEILHSVSVQKDITKRKQAEEALKESEERYRALVDTAGLAGEGIMITERNAEGKTVVAFANETLAHMLGYKPEEMTGILGRELLLPGDRVLLYEKHRRRREGEKLPSHCGVMALRKDGSLLPIELSTGTMNLQGKPATVVYIRDVTDRKAAEEALRQSETQFRAIFENAAMGVGVVDSQGHLLKINAAFEEMVGYTSEELRKMPFKAYMHPDDAFSDAKLFAEMLAVKRDQYAVEKRYIRKDGQTVWGRVTLSAVRDANGKLSFAIEMVEDITESKTALEKLQRSEEHFRALTENTMDAIVIVRGDGSIGYGSPSIERMLGYNHEEIVGPDGFRFAHPDDMPKVINNFAELMKDPRAAVRTELRIKHKNGSWCIVEAVANNLLDNQAIEGIVVNWHDITERKKAEEERVRHTRRVEALYAIAQAVSQTLELEELLKVALGKTLEVMEADSGGIYLIDVLEKALVLRASQGLPQEVEEQVIEKLSDVKLGMRKFQEIQKWSEGSLRLEDVFGENVRSQVSKAIEEAQIKSYAVVPFFIRGQLYGLIAVGTRIKREFSAADIDLLKVIGNQIGIGTHNATLYEEVRVLINDTLNAQERERERVCLEVHDGVAQTLVAAFQYLQTLEASSPDDKDIRGLIAKATVQVKNAIQESREVINSLQPATLRDLGLVPTLRHELKRLEKDTGLQVEFKADDVRLPKDVETGLYRIIHEAVFNARKHSNTKRLRVRINAVNGLVKVEVKDWGKGFAQARLNSSKRRGTGLFSIRKRTELLEGACDIRSAPGQGTTVYIEIPFTLAKE